MPDSSAKPLARIEKWKSQLLDLSLRNPLINYRPGRSVPVLCSDAAAIEDALALGRSFTIVRELPAGRLVPEQLLAERFLEQPLSAALRSKLDADLQKNLLHVRSPDKDPYRRLLEIHRAARLSLEEGGANTLFLAIGFLRWFETQAGEGERHAPLILVPVELHRKTARDAFKLQRIEEEAQINVTLTEKLRQDFGIELGALVDPPEDNHGLDVAAIIELVRRAVADRPRWQVLTDVHLGLFSFTKFLMWRDLERRTNDVIKNDVVKHLVFGPTASFEHAARFVSVDALDQVQRASDTYCPLDADSSQLAAVLAADSNITFVLEGPPGTGKSQTITNLIAQCLAHEKTVLFVSAKMEALKVVHHRLERVGLGEFCLELHSNKARKKDVLQKLAASLQLAAAKPPAAWDAQASELEGLRGELNQYVTQLHAPRETGESLFDGLSKLIAAKDAPAIALPFASMGHVDGARKKELFDRVAQIAATAAPLGGVHRNPWRHVGLDEWSQPLHQKVQAALEALKQKTERLAATTGPAGAILKADRYPQSAAALQNNRTMAALLLKSPCPPETLLRASAGPERDWEQTQHELRTWIAHGRTRDRLRQSLAERYAPELFGEARLPKLHQRFVRWCSFTFIVAWVMLWFARRRLHRYATRRWLPSNRTIARDLEQATQVTFAEQELSRIAPAARAMLGVDHRRARLDWERLAKTVDWVCAFQRSVEQYLALGAGDHEIAELRQHLLHLASVDRSEETLGHKGQQALSDFIAAYDDFVRGQAEVAELLCLDEAAFVPRVPSMYLGGVRDRVVSWLSTLPELRDYCHYRQARTKATEQGLGALMRAHDSGQIATEQLMPALERSFYEHWVAAVLAADPALSGFVSVNHVRKIDRFKTADTQLLDLARDVVRARLAARIPPVVSDAPEASSMGILLRETKKKTRHLPIRLLFARIPELLQRLKPCMLMSPLSVAQYITAEVPQFDVVVFDEASQIPTHDAIGSIARGKQLVVVGDSKQLPPTTFFSKEDEQVNPPSEDEIVELESILDECVAARLPTLTLRWHYRSRHEDLIAFSNQHYYERKLCTYPSPISRHPAFGVDLRHVPGGVYERSGSRTNHAEAEAVVAELVRMLHDPVECYRSIGVVTFSVAQQQLIEDLLDEARCADPTLERFFDASIPEPVFIKNLENVQGDERDVMLFSICYGPDQSGKVWYNFGPLNMSGGQRRLNVAVTRARERMTVFATLRPEQIDLGRAQATGAQHLKHFLEYARRGSAALAQATDAASGGSNARHTGFEQALAEALRGKGFEVATQVGASDYRVDLAVVDPEDKGSYLLGIVGDGAHYLSGKTARDRERLRHAVLVELGWTLHRVWAVDYWHDPKGELARIGEALARAQQTKNGGKPLLCSNAVASTPPSSTRSEAASSTRPAGAPSNGAAASPELAPELASALAENIGPVYTIYPTAPPVGTAETFHALENDLELRAQLIEIIQTEAPMHQKELARRIASLYDISRLTKRVTDRVEEALRPLLESGALRLVEEFYWRDEQSPEAYDLIRVPAPDLPDTRRSIDHIPTPELCSCALTLLKYSVALDLDDLVRETAKTFGWPRVGDQGAARIRQAVFALVAAKQCALDGERVSTED